MPWNLPEIVRGRLKKLSPAKRVKYAKDLGLDGELPLAENVQEWINEFDREIGARADSVGLSRQLYGLLLTDKYLTNQEFDTLESVKTTPLPFTEAAVEPEKPDVEVGGEAASARCPWALGLVEDLRAMGKTFIEEARKLVRCGSGEVAAGCPLGEISKKSQS